MQFGPHHAHTTTHQEFLPLWNCVMKLMMCLQYLLTLYENTAGCENKTVQIMGFRICALL